MHGYSQVPGHNLDDYRSRESLTIRLYATQQGSKSAKFYYKHITNATYKALGLLEQRKPKIRDTLGLMEISQLSTAEYMVQSALRKYMDDKIPYNILYKMVVSDLERFANTLFLGENPRLGVMTR